MTASSRSTRTTVSRLSMAVALATVAAGAQAAPPQFNDVRALGMGGTGVASARPSGAALFNPSLLAAEHDEWNNGFAATLPSANARYAENDEVVDEIDRIQDTIEAFEQAIDANNQEEAQDNAGELADSLESVNEETMRGDAGIGTLLAIPSENLAVGLHVNAQLRATVQANMDEDEIDALREIEDANTIAEIQNNELVGNDGTIDDLDSDGRVLGSAVGEMGLTLARSFNVRDQKVSFGVTPKLVQMRTFDYAQGVDDFDEDDFDASEYETEDSHLNLDVGASTQLGRSDQWRLGASVRNLIPQTLKTVEDNGRRYRYEREEMKLDPLVTVGVAHTSGWHTLTADLDLTKNEGMGPAADQQWLSLGGEFNVYDWVNVRAGARQNLASDTGESGIEEETQYTAGVSFSPWAMRIEAGALYSSEEVGGAVELGMSF